MKGKNYLIQETQEWQWAKISKSQNQNQDIKQASDQFQNKKKSIYPYTKKHYIKKIKTKDISQIKLDEGDTILYLARCLSGMRKYGFDLSKKYYQYSSRREQMLRQKHKLKTIARKIFINFKCPNCIDVNGKCHEWCSLQGNCRILFEVKDMEGNQDMKYPICLKWMAKIYRQKCKFCQRWGKPFMYKSKVQGCAIQFCRIISQIANGIPPAQHVENREKLYPQMHNHHQKLCESCMQGVCSNLPKSKYYLRREGEY